MIWISKEAVGKVPNFSPWQVLRMTVENNQGEVQSSSSYETKKTTVFLRRKQKNEVRKGVCKVFLCFERRRSHFVKVNITCLRKALLKWHYHRDKRAENCSLLKYVCSFVSTRHWTVWFAEKKLFFETFVLSKSATIMSIHARLLRVNALSS